MNSAVRSSLLSDGYVVIPDVYDPEDLAYLREKFTWAFDQKKFFNNAYNTETILNDIYHHFPDILDIIINERYVHSLRQALGNEIIWLPECAVHRNRYFNWHKDTTWQEIGGINSHKGNEILLQCATYFQSNTLNGGGLTAIPGTQYDQDHFKNYYKKDTFHRIWNKINKLLNISVFNQNERNSLIHDIPSKPGDLLLFDVRLSHRSTGFHIAGNQRPDKFAVYNTFGVPGSLSREYMDFMKGRPEPYYRHFRETRFPDVLYNKASQMGIEVLD